jgi:hypothetical protein
MSPTSRITATRMGFVLACAIVAADAVAQARVGWSLVWADEFAQADGSPPDPTKWVFKA